MENSVLGFRGHTKKCICVNPGKASSAFQQQSVLKMSSLREFTPEPIKVMVIKSGKMTQVARKKS